MKPLISPLQMIKQMFIETSPILKLLMLIIMMGISLVLSTFIGTLIAVPVFSISMEELQTVLEGNITSSNIHVFRFFQALQTISLFIIPALLAEYLILPERQGFLRSSPQKSWLIVGGLILLTLLTTTPLIQWAIELNGSIRFPGSMSGFEEKLIEMESERNVLSEKMIAGSSWVLLLLNMLIIAVLPSLGEEFFFRGVIQKIFHSWIGNAHVAIFISAAVFSAFHMQFYGFFPRLLLGVYFGYLFLWTRNIWFPVLAHFLNNALAIFMVFLYNNEMLHSSLWLEDNESFPFIVVLFSIAFSIPVMYATWKITKKS